MNNSGLINTVYFQTAKFLRSTAESTHCSHCALNEYYDKKLKYRLILCFMKTYLHTQRKENYTSAIRYSLHDMSIWFPDL